MVAVHTLIDAPADFLETRLGSADYPIPPYAKFLKDVTICLDPGHGGDADKRAYKRGPNGVREAEVNLRVAQYLRELLVRCGAEVRLTREEDVDSSLSERANVANEWGADLFISLHHNAVNNKPQVNHTTVWYHNTVDYRPSSLDLARHLCEGLYDGLRLSEITTVPLKSDQLMYASGFGMLRAAKVTAALCESSFFTNPEEEQRLRTPEHNLKEAYGLFIGLARYAAGGLPRAKLIEPPDGIVLRIPGAGEEKGEADALDAESVDGAPRPFTAFLPGGRSHSRTGDEEDEESGEVGEAGPQFEPPELVFQLDDGLRGRKSWGWERQMILSDSIAVRIDGEDVEFEFANEGYQLTVEVPEDLEPGQHEVEVQFQNLYKNSVLNPHFVIEVW